jgi:L-threonylcarbamoyladenylate synthase
MKVMPEEAGNIVKEGGVIVYPTETVYGIGGNALEKDVWNRIRKIKERPKEKGFIILIKEPNWLEDLVEFIPENAWKLIKKFWPGPLTIVFPVRKSYRYLFGKTVAIRVSPHPYVKEILEISGVPLISTSANISGEGPVKDFKEAEKRFGDLVDGIVDGECWGEKPSTIFNSLTGEILREGPISKEEIERLLL